jgi:hypothetical protein
MTRSAVIATAVPISNDLTVGEKAKLFRGESRLYSRLPEIHVLSIRTEISVPSMRYSLQCTLSAFIREADGASAVTEKRRGVDMATSRKPFYRIPDSSTADTSSIGQSIAYTRDRC